MHCMTENANIIAPACVIVYSQQPRVLGICMYTEQKSHYLPGNHHAIHL